LRKILVGTVVAVASVTATGVAIAQVTGGVPDAQPRSGAPANVLAVGFTATPVATGAQALENPIGQYTKYGYLNDRAAQSSGLDTKTEPDQNTYLSTATNPGGPAANYDYGRHFLIQGHEIGGQRAYVTRVNLDVPMADPHRITLLSTPGGDGKTGADAFDGSVYDPFTGSLLYTGEGGDGSGVWQQDLVWSGTSAPPITHLANSMGSTIGDEGISVDSHGNLTIVEDSGGGTVTDNGTPTKVKYPNSFVYRFKPKTPSDLTQGKLQVLQASVDGQPIVFHADAAAQREDALGAAIKRLHSGEELDAKWITIHDTDVDPAGTFVPSQLAKAKGGTPFKRPENGKFVPETGFRSYVFVETGDTDKDAATYPGAAERGSWGALLRVDTPTAGSDIATLRTIVRGDEAHASFDNISFLDAQTALVSEDRGETLHQQANRLDSMWAFNIRKPLDEANADAQRVLAQGRDAEATNDAALVAQGKTQNAGDNEVTGIQVSNGSTSVGGLLGAYDPSRLSGVRIFVTDQHGTNTTSELQAPAPPSQDGAPGPDGAPGADGAQGAPGADGNPGAQGPQGAPGVQGAAGANGKPGADGRPGRDGKNGVIVVRGSQTRSSVRLKVTVPVAGTLRLSLKTRSHGRTVALGTGTATARGRRTLTLTLKPGAAGRRFLRAHGHTSAVASVRFAPKGGVAGTVTRKLTLHR
jgi:hypothetical protein